MNRSAFSHVVACVGVMLGTGCASAPAKPPVDTSGLRKVTTAVPVTRDSSGRVLDSGSSLQRAVQAASDSTNARVRTLRLLPDTVVALVGDTLKPELVVRISGLDSTGAEVPKVVPLYGRFAPAGIVQRLNDGRWLMLKVGEARATIRPMRFDQQPSNDTALVRTLTIVVLRKP